MPPLSGGTALWRNHLLPLTHPSIEPGDHPSTAPSLNPQPSTLNPQPSFNLSTPVSHPSYGSPVSIPHQSSYRIREFRERHNHALEFRVPPHHTDILVAIGMTHKVCQKPNSLCRIVSELYLSKIFKPEGRGIRQKIMEALEDDLAKGKSNDRLSCLFADTTYSALKTIAQKENVRSSTIVKGIIVVAKHDILDNEDRGIAKEFEDLAASRL